MKWGVDNDDPNGRDWCSHITRRHVRRAALAAVSALAFLSQLCLTDPAKRISSARASTPVRLPGPPSATDTIAPFVRRDLASGAPAGTEEGRPTTPSLGRDEGARSGERAGRETGARPPGNRTLVVVLGSLRGGEEAWESLARHVLDPSRADLALLVPRPDGAAPRTSLHARAEHLWHFRDYDDWGDAVDLIPTNLTANLTAWRQLAKREEASIRRRGHPARNPSVFGGVRGHGGSGAVIFMLRYWLQDRIRRHGLISRYDRFVVTRSDHYYECPHNASAFPVHGRQLWVPEGQWYHGRTDRHLIVGSHNVLAALDVYPTYFTTPWIQDYDSRLTNTEILLHLVWQEKGLAPRSFPRVMFTVARPADATKWRRATVPVPRRENLYVKYPADGGGGPGEYTLAQRACHPSNVTELPRRKNIATVRLA